MVQRSATVPRARRARAAARALALILLAGALAAGIKEGRWFVFPKRFAQVEPRLFRSGQIERWPYERVVDEHEIRTVLRLNALLPGDRRERTEREVLGARGIELVELNMVGSGIAPFDDLERAADFVGDRSRWPLLFHCAGGDRRSSAVMAVYRLRCCGWDWAQTSGELAEYGITPGHTPELFQHLELYARGRSGAP